MKKILTFGVYDFFHIGHLRLFENCKKHGDYLIVAVQDGEYILKFKPDAQVLYTTEQRLDLVRALRVVDEAIIYTVVGPEMLSSVDFDILALGEDQTAERFARCEQWCLEHGKKVVRMKRTPGICSSEIKNNIK